MKILFLNAYFKPEQIAFSHLENDLLEGIIAAGHDVCVICPLPTRGISKEMAGKYRNKKNESLYGGHVTITRFYAPQESANPFARTLRYFWCNVQTYRIGIKRKDIDVIFCCSTPPTQGWIAGKIAKRLHVPFLYSLQDIFPDSLVNAGMTREGSMIWRIGRHIENTTYKGASKIIVISEGFKRNVLSKRVREAMIKVIPNWINTEKVYPVARKDNKIIKKYNLDPSKFYVCYSGNIGHSQNLELLVEAAKKLKQETEAIEFVVIGEGAAKDYFHEMVEAEKLTNIHMIPFQPYEDIAHVFSIGDTGLIISKKGVGVSSVPGKTWSIMAAERPILASFDRDSDLSEIINRNACGLVSDPESSDGLVKNIMRLYSDSDLCRSMGRNGKRYLADELNKDKCVGLYVSAFNEIVKSKRRGVLDL